MITSFSLSEKFLSVRKQFSPSDRKQFSPGEYLSQWETIFSQWDTLSYLPERWESNFSPARTQKTQFWTLFSQSEKKFFSWWESNFLNENTYFCPSENTTSSQCVLFSETIFSNNFLREYIISEDTISFFQWEHAHLFLSENTIFSIFFSVRH